MMNRAEVILLSFRCVALLYCSNSIRSIRLQQPYSDVYETLIFFKNKRSIVETLNFQVHTHNSHPAFWQASSFSLSSHFQKYNLILNNYSELLEGFKPSKSFNRKLNLLNVHHLILYNMVKLNR